MSVDLTGPVVIYSYDLRAYWDGSGFSVAVDQGPGAAMSFSNLGEADAEIENNIQPDFELGVTTLWIAGFAP
jgi:hypothetical protein